MNNNEILVITHWNEKSGLSSFLASLTGVIENGYKSIQLRLEGVTKEQYAAVALLTSEAISGKDINLFLNCHIDEIPNVNATGIHLKSAYAARLNKIPDDLRNKYLFSTPCHNLEEINHANALGFDFGIITPIKRSFTCPDKKSIGWEQACQMLKESSMPMYAAGGLTKEDLNYAKELGFCGVAGIGSFFHE